MIASGTKSVCALPAAARVVVVALAAGDVAGQRGRDGPTAGTVTRDDLSDVIADHAAEPAALVAAVLPTGSSPSVT